MNKDQIEGNWEQMKAKAKQQWHNVTNDHIELLKDKEQEFAGKLQADYGRTKEQAKKEIDDFKKSCGCSSNAA